MPPKKSEKNQLTSVKQDSFLSSYRVFLEDVKARIRSSQIKAAIKVNSELISLYWSVGNSIIQKQEIEGWGAKTIEKLAKDLSSSFPDMKGFSLRNLQFMVQFAKEYPDIKIVKQLVSQIPWGHNILILQKIKILEEKLWYIQKTIENGWSRNVLLHWIDSDLFQRQGKAITNFQTTLPEQESDIVRQTIKDPYILDFLTLRERHDEKELEAGLMEHIQRFLLELGTGFAFVGRQYRLEVNGKEFFIDLLFYHFKLRRFFVVELKAREFDPRDAGQMNFYLSAVDDLLKHPDDEPTIGLLLCKTKDNIIVEYALRNTKSPIGVAGYETKLVESLPKNLKGSLPTVEEIERELEDS